MKNWLTVKELIEVLSKHDPDLKTTVFRDGNDHHSPVLKADVKVVKDPYFGDSRYSLEEGEKVLRVGMV